MRILIASVLALAALAGSASADVRNLSGFTSVSSAGRFDIEVSTGEAYRVEVTGPDAARVESEIDGRQLRLRVAGWHLFGEPELNATVHVIMPRVEALAVARGSDMTATNIRNDDISIAVSMGGSLRVSGACQNLNVAVSMGGSIDANDLDCAAASVAASMGGDVRIHARESVSASASMGGDIHVSGNPPQRSFHASMGGDISYN